MRGLTPKERVAKLSEQRMREVLEFMLESPFYEPYVALRIQQHEIANQIRNANIVFGDPDDAQFDALMKWVDKAEKMAKTIDFYYQQLNPSQRIEAQKEVLSAKPAQLESKVKNRKDDA